MALDRELLDVLACPQDRGDLLYFDDEPCLYNRRLRFRYPIRDGVPVLLVDEAEKVDDAEHDRLMGKSRV